MEQVVSIDQDITIGAVDMRGYNGATWDEWRNNQEVELLASAARITGLESATQTNYNGRGVLIALNITAQPGTADTIQLMVREATNSSLARMLLTFPAVAGTAGVPASYIGILYPGATNSKTEADIVAANDVPLPRKWRILVAHSGEGSFTYSVTAQVII